VQIIAEHISGLIGYSKANCCWNQLNQGWLFNNFCWIHPSSGLRVIQSFNLLFLWTGI